MSELEILLAQREQLLKDLKYWQQKLSEEKRGRRADEKKNIRKIEKQIKEVDQKIKEVQKYSYLTAGVEQGMDLRSNQINAVAGVVGAVGTAVGTATGGGLLGEFGLYGRGKADIERTKRGQGSAVPVTSSSTMMYVVGGAFLLILLMRKR